MIADSRLGEVQCGMLHVRLCVRASNSWFVVDKLRHFTIVFTKNYAYDRACDIFVFEYTMLKKSTIIARFFPFPRMQQG